MGQGEEPVWLLNTPPALVKVRFDTDWQIDEILLRKQEI